MAEPKEMWEDRSTTPTTVEEMAAWQLPPQVDLEGIATLMVLWPTASLDDLQRTMEANLPRADMTAYAAAATRLDFQAMQVYERNLPNISGESPPLPTWMMQPVGQVSVVAASI